MTTFSAKTLVIWLLAIGGCLALGAFLDNFGLSSAVVMGLNMVAITAALAIIARNTLVREAQSFLDPFQEGPNALTPPSVAAEWLSGLGLVGTVTLMLLIGIDGFALALGMVGGLVLSGTVIAPALAQSGSRTLSGWVGARFGDKAQAVATLLFAVVGLLLIWVQFALAGLVMEAAFEVPGPVGIVLAGILVLLCVSAGGMGTMVPSQALLFAVILVGVLIPAMWLGIAETGTLLPWFAPGALLHEIGVAEARLDLVEGFGAHDPLRAMMLGVTGLFGTMALPHTLMRWPMTRRAQVAGYFAQRSVVLTVIVLTALPVLAIATRAAELVPALANLTTPDMYETPAAALAGMVRSLDPPSWLLAALGTAALAAIVASASGAVMLIACGSARGFEGETAGGVVMRLRWVVAVIVVIAMVLAVTVRIEPVSVLLALMVIVASMLLAPLMLGLFWPRATAGGALAGVVVGGICAVASLALNEHSLLSGATLMGVAASVVSMVLVSLMGKPVSRTPLTLLTDEGRDRRNW